MTYNEQQDQAPSQDPQPATHETLTDSQPTPKKRNPALITIIVAVVAIGVGAALFFTRPTSGNNAYPEQTGAGAAIAGMTQYQYGMDNELLFSYPSTWYPHDKHGMLFFLKAPNTPDKEGTETYAYGQQITIRDWNLTDDKGNRLTEAQYDAYVKQNPQASKDESGNPILRKNVTMNGIPMTRIDQMEYTGSYRTLSYEIVRGGLVYQIRLYPYNPDHGYEYDKQNIEDLEKLIKTVHFVK